MTAIAEGATAGLIAAEDAVLAHNYHPLPVVVAHAWGSWVTDVDGRRYLDLLAGYSALNFGHRHPRLITAAKEQLERVTLTSRAFRNDRLGEFAERLCALTGYGAMLPMNTGAEAVESGIKLARKHAYERRGVPEGQAEIVVAENNFHGRTTTVVGFSSDPDARTGFGPFTPGFRSVPYGDADALAAAVGPNTAAVLLEPIQGEAGVIIPPEGYLAAARRITEEAGALLVADEIQSGLGRTGTLLAVEHEGVRPDVVLLGKALGGGIVPVSAVLADRDVMDVLHPGEHGSTFGGNPLAAAVGTAVCELLEGGEYQRRAAELAEPLRNGLEALADAGVTGFRARGLWAGVDVDPALGTGREICADLMAEGVLAKDTHGSTVRLAPPLTITRAELDDALGALARVLRNRRASA